MKRKVKWTLFAFCLFLTLFIPIAGYFAIRLPAEIQYNRLFGTHVTMAMDQATFPGIKDQVLIAWQNMDKAFEGRDYAATYNSPWYWDWFYENSLAAQRDYFKQLVTRLDNYEATYQEMKESKTQTFLQDWYDQGIKNVRSEMNRSGGLDWALKGAWFLTFAPAAYWFAYWMSPVVIVLVIVDSIVFAIRPKYERE